MRLQGLIVFDGTKMVESNQIPGGEEGLHPIVRGKKTSER